MQTKKGVFSSIDYFVFILFIISLFSPITVFVLYVGLLFFLIEGTKGGVKALFWLTVRGLISTAVGASVAQAAIVKWILLLAISVWILIVAKPNEETKKKLRSIFALVALFSGYSIVSSLLFGSYPLISAFKVISFAVPMLAIFIGIADSAEIEEWTEYYYRIFFILLLISLGMFPYNQFRIINDDFQGLFNHVNILGIICALFIAVTLNRTGKKSWLFEVIVIAAVVVMEYFSRSRTGMFSIIGIFVTWLLFRSRRNTNAVAYIVFIIAAIVFIPIIFPEAKDDIGSMATTFVLKNQTAENVFASRYGLTTNAVMKFESNPIFGRGFMTPYNPGVRSFDFSFDLIVEPGNLIYAVLGDTGIIGTIIFAAFLTRIFMIGDKKKLSLFVGAIMINMGEMVFFSSNNMSILVYYLLAIYMFGKQEETV